MCESASHQHGLLIAGTGTRFQTRVPFEAVSLDDLLSIFNEMIPVKLEIQEFKESCPKNQETMPDGHLQSVQDVEKQTSRGI